MRRRRLALAAAVFPVLLLGAAAPAGVASPAALRWRVVAQGKTKPRGQDPVGYVARTFAGAKTWRGRLTAADRKALQRVDFGRKTVVAVFLDGFPCAAGLRMTGFSLKRRRVFATFVKPRIGIATCIRQSISYVVAVVSTPDWGTGRQSRIEVVARARA